VLKNFALHILRFQRTGSVQKIIDCKNNQNIMYKFLLPFLLTGITASAQLNIETLLSAPFPSELHGSPDGKYLTWAFNNKGVRNIWFATENGEQTKQITHYTEDDGLEITNLCITPDDNKILFVRGNDANRRGEVANPALLQVSAEQALYVSDINGDTIHKIGVGIAPAISPDGKMVAYISSSQIWIASLDSLKPEKLFQSRGNQMELRWSPDSRKIAFVSNRGDHAFTGIYDFTTKTFSYPDASVDLDFDPVWSPDGKYIAYIRQPHIADALPFTPMRSSLPWSIRLLNVTTGKAHEMWKAGEGMGSAFVDELPATENHLWFTADNKIIFPSEKDGWMHLYALDIQNGETKLLTPGDGEVENVESSIDKRSIIYCTNIGDISRRHIYKITSSGSPVMLTKGDGIEYAPVVLANGIAVLRSTAQHPLWPAIIQTNGSLKDVAANEFPNDFPSASLVIPQVISFTSTDGMQISAQLFLPKDVKANEKHPALIFFHGGSRRQMLPAFHYMQYYYNAYALNQYFASKGYIVMSVNYRSGIGYGLNFREALNYGAQGASEVNDVIGAGLYLRSRTDVDGKRIALWGGSYGGYLTAFGLAKASDIFACGVDIHGVHNWNTELPTFAANYDPAKQEAFAKLAYQSSPVAYADSWHSPVLFIHGDDDRNVPFNETVTMAEELRKRKVYFEELVLPDEIHDFLLFRSWLKVYNATFDFIDKEMK